MKPFGAEKQEGWTIYMKQSKSPREILLLLLRTNIIQFVAGTLAIFVILLIARTISYIPINWFLKSLGYSFYYYLTTPFIVYWLAYASATKLSRTKIIITITLMSMYSYVMWDSYFFFKEAMDLLLLKMNA